MRICYIWLSLILSALTLYDPAWAINSLVRPTAVKKLKAAGISNEVIELLITEQTCSIKADDLLALKKHGADDKILKAVILADRYKNPTKAELSAQQLELLRKAGLSDALILRLFHVPSAKRVIDEQGNESIVYGFDGPSSVPPPQSDQPHNNFRINIEKVETR